VGFAPSEFGSGGNAQNYAQTRRRELFEGAMMVSVMSDADGRSKEVKSGEERVQQEEPWTPAV
jgi:hypothetical protein